MDARVKPAHDGQCVRLPPLITRLRVPDVEFSQRAGNDKIIIVEHQGPRHAVLEQFERHRINRRLLAVLGLGVAVVIADRDRPAHRRFHLVVGGRGIGRSDGFGA